ncbi:MAG: pyridoxal-phosphate dependent enzyme, partial [Gemmatimonadales bacterium]
ARAWLAARRLGTPRWVPGGGAHPRAVIGHLLAALELGDQLPAPPDAVVLPLGTGSTAAGLVLGLACLGWPTRVVGVRVAPPLIANAWRSARLARAGARLLARQGVAIPRPPSFVPVVIDGLGRGYGFATARGEAARSRAAEHGLALDSTYGAKAFAALSQLPGRRFHRIVFWHTFAFPPSPASELHGDDPSDG